jgi:hypothetical protein
MLIHGYILRCKSSHIDDAEEIGFIWLNLESHVLRLVDQGGIWNRLGTTMQINVEW